MPLADDIARARAAGKTDEDIIAYLMRQGMLRPEEVAAAEKAGKSATDVLTYVAPEMLQARGAEHSAPQITGGEVAADLTKRVGRSVAAVGTGAAYKSNKILDGIAQMFGNVQPEQNKQMLENLAAKRAAADAAFAPVKAAHPWATDIGGAVPATLAAAAGGLTPAGPFLGGLALGTLPGALSYGSPGERAKEAVVDTAGNLVGGVVGRIGARLVKPAGAVKGIAQETLEAAERIGYPTTVGQRTGNLALLTLEERLRRAMGSAGLMQEGDDLRQAALNRAANAAMGQKGETLNAAAFSTAKTALQAEKDRLQALAKPAFGQDFMEALNKLELANREVPQAFRTSKIDKLVQKGAELAAHDDLTGAAYSKVRTKLTEQADKAFKGRGGADLGNALKTVRGELDKASGLSAAEQEALDLFNRQWAAYKLASKGNVSKGGNINPTAVAQALSAGGDAFRTGSVSGPMVDVARIGDTLKRVQTLQGVDQPSLLTFLPHMFANEALGAAYTNPLAQNYLTSNMFNLSPSGYKAAIHALRPTGAPIAQGLLRTDD